jgi:hypothetical protein
MPQADPANFPDLARRAVETFLDHGYGVNRGFRSREFPQAAELLRPFVAYTPLAGGRKVDKQSLDRVYPSFWHAACAVLLEFVESRIPELPTGNAPAVYRGQTCPWPLRPSLWRVSEKFASCGDEALKAFGAFLAGTFNDKPDPSYEHFSAVRKATGAAALAQHHEFPTNLIDFTYDPLIALHFASLPACRSDVPGCPPAHGVIFTLQLRNFDAGKKPHGFVAHYELLPPAHVLRIYQQRGILVDCGDRAKYGKADSGAEQLESACVRLFFPRDYPSMADASEVLGAKRMAHWMADEASYWHTPQTQQLQRSWYLAYEWYEKPLEALKTYCADHNGRFSQAEARRLMDASIAGRPAPWSTFSADFESPVSQAGRLAEYLGNACKFVLDACRYRTRDGWRLERGLLRKYVAANPEIFAAMCVLTERIDVLDVRKLRNLILNELDEPELVVHALNRAQIERLLRLPSIFEEGQVRYVNTNPGS